MPGPLAAENAILHADAATEKRAGTALNAKAARAAAR